MTTAEKTLSVLADIDLLKTKLYEYAVDLGCCKSEDGFLATALTGDEDNDTIYMYQRVFQPIKATIESLDKAYRCIERNILEPEYKEV